MFEWINNLTSGQQFALFSLVKICLALFAVVLPMIAYSVGAERRITHTHHPPPRTPARDPSWPRHP